MADVQFNFFGEASPYLSHPLLTNERSSAEIDAVLALVAAPSRVVDVGCGFGRHVAELASREISTIGIDPSAAMCSAARERVHDLPLAEIRQATATQLADQVESGDIEPFDLALVLFTTFGQLGQDSASASEQANALARLVCPGGSVVVEVPVRDRAVAALVEDEVLGPTQVTRTFDAETGTIHERFVTPNGTFDLGYQVFSQAELSAMLTDAGLSVSHIRESALAPPPPTFMTMVAQRPDGP